MADRLTHTSMPRATRRRCTM